MTKNVILIGTEPYKSDIYRPLQPLGNWFPICNNVLFYCNCRVGICNIERGNTRSLTAKRNTNKCAQCISDILLVDTHDIGIPEFNIAVGGLQYFPNMVSYWLKLSCAF